MPSKYEISGTDRQTELIVTFDNFLAHLINTNDFDPFQTLFFSLMNLENINLKHQMCFFNYFIRPFAHSKKIFLYP